jgi:UDP-N-acetylglucosamine 2-epimerase (non-hydrolysing)
MMVPVAHVESGLRSFDRGMPEEINRLVTDHLSDMLFTTCQDGNDNLKTEGVQADKIFFVGNIMIDTLMMLKEKVQRSDVLKDLKIKEKEYVVVTIHRPSNVDKEEQLRKIFDIFRKISGHIPIIFPAHPRTQKQISRFNIEYDQEKISIIDPLGYLDFMRLYMSSRFVMTDSGGIQEETTYLGIPCLTMRENTERPVTITEGTNELVGTDEKAIIEASNRILNNNWKKGAVPEFWDGKTSERIVRILEDN